MSYAEISRSEVPAGSFVYGQLASVDGLDAPLDRWLVGTACAHENADGSFSDVVCVHFIKGDEAEARETAADLARNHKTTLIAPAFREGDRVLAIVDYDTPPAGTIRLFEDGRKGRTALVALDYAEPGIGRQVVVALTQLRPFPAEARGVVVDPDTGERVETTNVELLASLGKLPEQQRLSAEGRRAAAFAEVGGGNPHTLAIASAELAREDDEPTPALFLRLDADARRKGDTRKVADRMAELAREYLGLHAIPTATERKRGGGVLVYGQLADGLSREDAVAGMRGIVEAIEGDRYLVDIIDQVRAAIIVDQRATVAFAQADYRGELRDWHLETLAEGRS
jgi:hypothetical protein